MAIPVEIILSAKDEASAVFDKAGSSLGSLGKAAALSAGAAGIGLVVGGLAAAGKAAIDMSSNLNQATNDISAQLGISKEAAVGFEETMKGVFANNFGEDFNEIGAGIVTMQQNLKDLTPASQEAQQAMLEGAFAIQDAFGVELNDTFNAVNSLMKDFGLSGQEAMDLVTAGFQRGLDTSGDFLDSITEYAPQFSNAGADAGQFFSLMESGLQGGVLGVDKAADAFKEFRVRIQDGSDATIAGLDKVGISAEGLAEQMADGSVTAVDAFQMVIERLGDMEDENERMVAGVQLLGTQFEDLGTTAVLNLDLSKTGVEDLSGSTDSLNQQYESIGAVFEGAWRQLLVAIEPAGKAMLEVANEIMPLLTDFMKNDLTPAIEEAVKVTVEIGKVMKEVWNVIAPTVKASIGIIVDAIQLLVKLIRGDFKGAWEELKSIVDRAMNAVHETIRLIAPRLISAIKGIVKDMKNAFTSVDWNDIGRGIIDGIKGGVQNAAGGLADAAKGAAQSALDKTKGFLGIGSPSRLFRDEVGVPIGEGIALGIMESGEAITNAVISVTGNALAVGEQMTQNWIRSTARGHGGGFGSPSFGGSGSGFGSPSFGGTGSGFGNLSFGGTGSGQGAPVVHFNDCNFNGTDRDAAHKFGNELAKDLRRECGF